MVRFSTRRLPVSDRPRIIPGNSFPYRLADGIPVSGAFSVHMFIGPSRWPLGRVV